MLAELVFIDIGDTHLIPNFHFLLSKYSDLCFSYEETEAQKILVICPRSCSGYGS